MDKQKNFSLPLTFDVVVFYELIIGCFEALLGFGLIIFGEELTELYQNMLETGVLDSPHTFTLTIVQKYAPYLSNHHLFLGLYLLIVGVIKVVCGYGLSQRHRWADYLLVALLLVFLPFDILGLTNHPSIGRILFVLANILIMIYLTGNKITKHILKS